MELSIWLPAAIFVGYLMFDLYKDRYSELDKRETHDEADIEGRGDS